MRQRNSLQRKLRRYSFAAENYYDDDEDVLFFWCQTTTASHVVNKNI